MKMIQDNTLTHSDQVFYRTMMSTSEYKQQSDLMSYIVEIVGHFYKLQPDYNSLRSRKREFIVGRQVAMYLMKTNTMATLTHIGSFFNNKDHATVSHAVNIIKGFLEWDKKTKKEITQLQKRILIKSKIGNADQQFYHIDLNNFKSMMLPNDKGVVLTGFSDDEISKIEHFFGEIIDKRDHEQTGMYILEKRSKDE